MGMLRSNTIDLMLRVTTSKTPAKGTLKPLGHSFEEEAFLEGLLFDPSFL